jgi:cell division protein FtsB
VNPDIIALALTVSGIANIACAALLVAGADYVRRQRHKLARQADVVRDQVHDLQDAMEHNDRLQVENEGLAAENTVIRRENETLRAENVALLDGRYEESPS